MTDQNCWKCRHNDADNCCENPTRDTDEWIEANVVSDSMPPKQTETACPGFARDERLTGGGY